MLSSNDFYEKLTFDKSKNILEQLKDFTLNQFPNICENMSDFNEISEEFASFVSKLSLEFAKIWNIQFYIDRNWYKIIIDGFEDLLCNSLYDTIMNLFPFDDENKINYDLYNNITLKTFKINDYDYQSHKDEIQLQISKFKEFSVFKTPKQKLIVLSNLCNYINYTYANRDRNKLLKFLTFMLMHSKIENLQNELIYCLLFRNKTVIESDEDFYLSIALQTRKNFQIYAKKINTIQNKEDLFEDEIIESEKKMKELKNINDIPTDLLSKDFDNNEKMKLHKYELLRQSFRNILNKINENNNN
jgi:hypothetical protein